MVAMAVTVRMLVFIAFGIVLMPSDVTADVCADNMIFMDLCVQWSNMCEQSDFLREKCPRTCETCAPEDCIWGPWGNFTECTETCGGGFKTRSRVVATPPLYGGAACEGDAFESIICNPDPCPVDCEWNEFGDWSPCNQTCDGGTQFRERTVRVAGENGGNECIGDDREERACNVHNCAVNCEFDEWEEWTQCTATCNGGTRFRTRGIKVAAAYGGAECDGDIKEEETCNNQPCPVPCQWEDWGEWDTCSQTCGGGMHARVRNVATYAQFGGDPCPGEAAEMGPCNEQPCPRDCEWGPYGEFTDCSVSCGEGLKSRTREIVVEADQGGRKCIGEPVQELSCFLRPCGIDCEWDEWGDWSTCSLTCGGGEQTRSRVILRPEAFGGVPCVGPPEEARACNEDACPVPVDCVWSEYGNWTQCSKSCGGGTQLQTRTIVTQALNGGKSCDGINTNLQICNEFPCPEKCLWNDFSAWSECDKDCGAGSQFRTRTVFQEARFGGEPCEGDEHEVQVCNENPCAVNCLWNEFGPWSNCTEECDGGTQTRVRTIQQEAAYGGMTCQGYATESRNCNEEPCQRVCQWEPYSAWTPCSQSCAGGLQSRSRLQVWIRGPAAGVDGIQRIECAGAGSEDRECNLQPCPINCEWSAFSTWTPCSQDCGGGYQMRTRKIAVEPENGGRSCEGCATDSRACNDQPCARNCKWAPWHAWSECTSPCGGGTQNRTRDVLQAAANGGEECEGEQAQFRDCNIQKCPINCEWGPWGEWDICTRTCGGGMQGRSREILQPERHGGIACEGDPQEMQGCNMEACPICKDHPRYARFCPTWTEFCSNSEFVQGCCQKSCRLC